MQVRLVNKPEMSPFGMALTDNKEIIPLLLINTSLEQRSALGYILILWASNKDDVSFIRIALENTSPDEEWLEYYNEAVYSE